MHTEIAKIIDGCMKFIYDYIDEGSIILNLPNYTDLIRVSIKNKMYEVHNTEIQENNFDGFMVCLESNININRLSEVIEKNSGYVKNNGIIAIKCRVLDTNEMCQKENLIIATLKKKGIQDISTFGIYLKGEYNGIDLVVIGRVHYELLEESREYEEYSNNIVQTKGCCCNKKKGNSYGGCQGCGKKN